MLFNSYEFIFLYLPVVFLGFIWAARADRRLAALWLAAASLFFYGWWNPKFVLLLLSSIAFNYAMGASIGRTRSISRAKVYLILSILANLVLLGFFKYTNFFISTINNVSGELVPLTDIALPLGISFFTFTQITFLVDVYRGNAREFSFIHYVLFVSYFPHLIAGPVLHHKQMMPQFMMPETYRIRNINIVAGSVIFTIGLAKKVLLADSLGQYATPVFDTVQDGVQPKLVFAWIGALAYTLQLYFDFSGYSDMAIGLSRLFGVRLPINFNSPYKAHNIIEFWRRWHMTLSEFLREYLYVPLGGNRRGKIRRYINLMVTMLLGGLWHGANWTFVAWGGLHGLYLVINHAFRRLREQLGFLAGKPSLIGHTLGVGLTFLAVVVGWVFFRSENFSTALNILKGMCGLNGVSLSNNFYSSFLSQFIQISFTGAASELVGFKVMPAALLVFIGLLIVLYLPNSNQLVEQLICLKRNAKFRTAVGCCMGLLFGLCIGLMTRVTEFLYFQF